MSLPVVMTAAGLEPQTPTSLHDQIIAGAVALDPGLTANLPGTLIEDIASTDTAALVLIDTAQVETVNSMTPFGCNLFILNQLGQIYGVQQGLGSNVSVLVQFSGTPGFVIGKGVILSDGTYSYVTQDASVIGAGSPAGVSNSVYAVATAQGSWAVPANSVTTIQSSIPAGVTLTVTNPNAGIPASGVQTPEDYRSQVLAAGLTNCSSTLSAIKTAVRQVPGVVDTLVSVRQNEYYTPNRWEVIVGGGDPTAVANAIFQSCGDPNTLCGCIMQVLDVTTGGTTTIETNLVTGFSIGQTIEIVGAGGVTGVNGNHVITALPTPFSFSYADASSGSYTGGGTVTLLSTGTLPRNQVVTIFDAPDSYQIPFVVPIEQLTSVEITWKTSATGIVSNDSVQALCAEPIRTYINNLGPGQPINEYELQYVFQESIVTLVPTAFLIYIDIVVRINGVVVPPEVGTGIVLADPEGFYLVSQSGVTTVKV